MTERDKALVHFKRVDPMLYRAGVAVRKNLPETLPRRVTAQKLFESLASSIVSQQLATGAARSIWARVVAACKGNVTPRAIHNAQTAALRAAGLSGSKVKALQSLAHAVESNSLNLLSLKRMKEEEAVAALTRVWGVGPWTAEMFLIFALGRPDVFSAGDLGLVRAMERIYKLKKGAPREKLLTIAKRWTPYQSYACLILWRSHDAVKTRGTKAD